LESIAPPTTKAFYSIADLNDFRVRFEKTQLGLLMKDPVTKPFAEDLEQQLQTRIAKTGVQVGLTLQDVEGVAAGETAVIVIQPGGDKTKHSTAMMVDITGNHKEASKLLFKSSKDLVASGAVKSSLVIKGAPVTLHTMPVRKGETKARQIYHVIATDLLIATDSVDTVTGLVGRVTMGGESLAGTTNFKTCMGRVATKSGKVKPQIRWFIEPFGYAEVSRVANDTTSRKREADMLKILSNQGFRDIQGIAGYVHVDEGGYDFLHRSFVYAPGTVGAVSRFKLAARMLEFPNGAKHVPYSWVPADVATHASFNWKAKEAFEFSKTLVDEIAGDKIFDDVLDSIRDEEDGPRVDLRKDFIAHLGTRATVVTDFLPPINGECERFMFTIDFATPGGEAIAKATLKKALEGDPDAQKHVVDGIEIWEFISEDEEDEVSAPLISEPGFGAFGAPAASPVGVEDEEEITGAICIAHGQLMLASHFDYLHKVLVEATKEGKAELQMTNDYIAVDAALMKLGAGTECARTFARTRRAYEPSYELLKLGKMPESKTIMGGLLNLVFNADEKNPRKPAINGAKMPPFAAVEKYLKPAGAYVVSEKDGWFITGCLLK